jgi:hypothetical protein
VLPLAPERRRSAALFIGGICLLGALPGSGTAASTFVYLPS